MKVFFRVVFILLLPLAVVGQDRGSDHLYGRHDTYMPPDTKGEHAHDRSDYYGEPGSALTIFSENSEQFFLIINGVKQNAYPQTRVRVEGLPQVTNDVQIIFDDNKTQAIEKRIVFSDPVEGKAVNMVLKIARNKNGYPRLCFVRSTELMRDYRPEQGEYVMSYGRDRSTAATPPPAPREMDNKVFGDMKHAIASVSFDETKLSTAKAVLSSNYINTAQVMEVCRLFSFEDNKLEFAKFAYSKTVDPNNYFKVANVFNFSSSKEDFNNFLNGANK